MIVSRLSKIEKSGQMITDYSLMIFLVIGGQSILMNVAISLDESAYKS